MSENQEGMEIMALARGAKGDQGETGARGPRGPESSRRLPSVAYLFIVIFLLNVAGLLYLSHVQTRITATEHAIEHAQQQVNDQAADDHAQRCNGLLAVSRLPLLAGKPGANPSRTTLNTIILHYRQRAAELNCH